LILIFLIQKDQKNARTAFPNTSFLVRKLKKYFFKDYVQINGTQICFAKSVLIESVLIENVLGAFHNVQVFDSAQSRFFSSLLFDNKF
jgi:hypothetical protein